MLVGEVGGHAVVVIVGPNVRLVRADPSVGPSPGLPPVLAAAHSTLARVVGASA